MKIDFTLASYSDTDTITDILSRAISSMLDNGINQWDDIYPSHDLIKQDIKNGHMYKLVVNSEIVSFVAINDHQDDEYNDVTWKYTSIQIGVIHRLCVDPSYQRLGYGKLTMSLAESELFKKGYLGVRLDAFAQNIYAIKLYESMDYTEAGEVLFRKGKCICFEKKLI